MISKTKTTTHVRRFRDGKLGKPSEFTVTLEWCDWGDEESSGEIRLTRWAQADVKKQIRQMVDQVRAAAGTLWPGYDDRSNCDWDKGAEYRDLTIDAVWYGRTDDDDNDRWKATRCEGPDSCDRLTASLLKYLRAESTKEDQ